MSYGYGPPPAKKGVPTLVIVLLCVGGVLALIFVIGAVSAYRFTRRAAGSPIGKETARSLDAPGSNELMALGCNPVMIIDVASMPELTKLYRSDPRRAAQPVDVPLVIDCGPGLGSPRTCDEVADEYVRVATPTTPFRVFVHDYGQKPLCNERYAATGTRR